PSGSGQARPARRARKMQSRAAVALTPRLTAIWRLDMPAADSLSTSRILRTGNLGPGIAPLPMERSETMPIRGSPNGARHPRPQGGRDPPVIGGRDQSERLVAFNRNSWSRSFGTRSRVDGLILRANAHLFFWLSLLPAPRCVHDAEHGNSASMML